MLVYSVTESAGRPWIDLEGYSLATQYSGFNNMRTARRVCGLDVRYTWLVKGEAMCRVDFCFAYMRENGRSKETS